MPKKLKTDLTKKMLKTLKRALDLDQRATQYLVTNRVPGNKALAADKYIGVTDAGLVGMFGIINGFLAENGNEKIVSVYNRYPGKLVDKISDFVIRGGSKMKFRGGSKMKS